MKQIDVATLKAKLDNKEPIVVIDVREQNEYDEININAILHPLSLLKNYDLDAIEQFKNDEVVVHCRSGVRSLQACMIMEQAGFTNTTNLEGGIMAWVSQYPDTKISN